LTQYAAALNKPQASIASKDSAQLFGLNASSWALSTMLLSACERFGPRMFNMLLCRDSAFAIV
jgi:hypothetical protein